MSPQSPDVERLSFQKTGLARHRTGKKRSAAWHIGKLSEPEMPEEILNFIDWQDDATVYFCYENIMFLKTKWAIFKEALKNPVLR
ncbi:DUF2947 domain-containing protein [Vibrio chagasii]|nr:DUF2947 domain-containing protein [Vibrio chagasii]